MPLYPTWRSKPPQGTPIDRTHPLSQGMQGFYALNEGSGGKVYDAINDLTLAASGFGSANPWGGPALAIPTASHFFSATLPARLQKPWPITTAAGLRITTSGAGWLWGASYSNTWTAPYLAWMIEQNSGVWKIDWDNAGTLASQATASAYSANADYVVGLEITAAPSQKLYVNGSVGYSGTAAAGNPVYSANSLLFLGDAFGFSAPGVKFSWMAWWNRILTAQEHAAIGSSGNAIWQIFRHPSAFLMRSAAGPSFMPWIFGDQIESSGLG